MALNDFLSLADPKLANKFAVKAFDPTKPRETLAKRLDTAKSQFLSTEPTRGRKMFKINNSVVELTLPIEIGGATTHYIPSERFPHAIDKLKASLEAGELDKQLEFYANGIGAETGTVERKKRRPLTEEQKAAAQRKRAATMAERGIKPGRKAS